MSSYSPESSDGGSFEFPVANTEDDSASKVANELTWFFQNHCTMCDTNTCHLNRKTDTQRQLSMRLENRSSLPEQVAWPQQGTQRKPTCAHEDLNLYQDLHNSFQHVVHISNARNADRIYNSDPGSDRPTSSLRTSSIQGLDNLGNFISTTPYGWFTHYAAPSSSSSSSSADMANQLHDLFSYEISRKQYRSATLPSALQPKTL